MPNPSKKIQSIEPNSEQLIAIENLFYDKALDPKNFAIIAKNKKSLAANFFLDIPTIELEHLKKEIKNADYKKVVNKLSFISHGASALHFAALNSDPQVFNYLLEFFQANEIDYKSMTYAKESKTVSNQKKCFISAGDTVFNLVLSTGKKELIDNAIKQGFVEISCPILNYTNRKTDKVEAGNVLDFAVSQFNNKNNNSSSIEHKIIFYTRLALAIDTFDNLMGLLPYCASNEEFNEFKVKERLFSNSATFFGAYYFNLAYCPDLYKNENFVKVFIPTVLSFLASSESEEEEIAQDYVFTKESSQLEKTHPFIEAVLTFLEASPFFLDTPTYNKYTSLFNILLKQDTPFLIYQPDAVKIELEAMEVRREKKLISSNIGQVLDIKPLPSMPKNLNKL